MVRFVQIVFVFVVSSVFVAADDNSKALALLKGVEAECLKYDCFHIRYEEYWPEAKLTVEQIVDFDKGKIRKEFLPNESYLGRKSSLLENDVYSMMTYEDKHVAIVSRDSSNAYGAGLYDPRMLGLTDIMNQNMDVGICLLYKNRNRFSVSSEYLNDRRVHIVECRDDERNGSAHWKLYIEEPGFRLIKQTMEAKFGKIQVENDYSEKKFLPFPTKTHIYRVNYKEGKEVVLLDQYIAVKDVQIKKNFPPETFTLKGLNPPFNSEVVDYRINRRLGYWDGEKLVKDPARASAQEMREWEQRQNHQPLGNAVRYILMGTGIVMIIFALISMYQNRRKK